MLKKILMTVLLFAIVFSLESCGKKSKPVVKEGSTYPRIYPVK